MHELSIALKLLDIAAEECERQGGVSVETIHVRLGALSGVVQEALLSAFETARQGSRLAQAALRIEVVPVRVYCRSCQSEQTAESLPLLCCGRCGTASGEVIAGLELELTALEITVPSRPASFPVPEGSEVP